MVSLRAEGAETAFDETCGLARPCPSALFTLENENSKLGCGRGGEVEVGSFDRGFSGEEKAWRVGSTVFSGIETAC
jgi:hypothetical protein